MKDTLSQAKTDYRGLYQFWFIYGALNLCSYGFARLAASFPENFLIAILYAAENLLSSLLLIIFYIKIFRREYKTANRYYVSCISMWGIPAVIMPVLSYLLSLGLFIFQPDLWISGRIKTNLWDLNYMMDILLICLCFIICAYILEKKWLIVVGAATLIAYLTLRILTEFNITVITFTMENGNTSTTYIAPLFCQICTIVGYFFAAFMVRRAIKKRGDVANGPQ